MFRVVTAALALALALLVPGPARAQASSCTVPPALPRPAPALPSAREPARRMPVTAYTLALSWSPQHCRASGRPGDALQCGGRAGRFGFVVHGLWPDGADGRWPQYCAPAALLPEPLLRRHVCMTPSVDLLQHEWAKHGTCTGDDPQRYFERAARLYGALRFPDMAALSRRPRLTVGALRRAVADANRGVAGLTPAAVRVRLTRRGWLDELWLCLDTRLRYRACATGQSAGAGDRRSVRVWRGGGVETAPHQKR
jgi:ribonuclease T2